MQYNVYGFQSRNNSAFDLVFENISHDAKISKVSVVSPKVLSAVFSYLDSLMLSERTSDFGALASIGLMEYLLSRHQKPMDRYIETFQNAVANDPLKNYEDRIIVINNLQKQLGSYVKDVWNKNEYKEIG
jgi:hypothetical protein